MATNDREARTSALWPKSAVIACLLTAFGALHAAPAAAQCAPHDLKQMRVAYHRPAAAAERTFATIKDVPIWKTIAYDQAKSLHESVSALEQASCGIGNSLAGAFANDAPSAGGEKIGMILALV